MEYAFRKVKQMIDEKKLIEEIEKMDLHGRMREYAGLCAAVDIIKNQPKVGDWIPAAKPPKNDDYILLSFENFSGLLMGRYDTDEDGNGAYYLGDCDEEDTCVANDLFVNAWQPLPKPYDSGIVQKQTNADRIRNMSNEELTKIILCPYDSAGKPIDIMPCINDGNIQELVPPEDCKKCMLEWLQSEVEE